MLTVPRSCGNICSVCSTVSMAPCWQSRSTAPEQSARADSTFRPHCCMMQLLINCTHTHTHTHTHKYKNKYIKINTVQNTNASTSLISACCHNLTDINGVDKILETSLSVIHGHEVDSRLLQNSKTKTEHFHEN